MYLSKFTQSDDTEEFEGYTNGSLWNKWANVCFTREQLEEFLKTTPYDFKFSENGGIEQVTIWWERGDDPETITSTILPVDDQDDLVGYFLDLEFVEVGK